VSAKAISRAPCGRKGRMTYSGMARHKAADKAQAVPRMSVVCGRPLPLPPPALCSMFK
jgi:hypothetical protein